jgi:neurotransmitter:Na+ symporter, NSS family
MAERENWSSRFGFLMASIGYSMGVGNFWRFPYMAGTNGGGVFLLFYLIVVALITIPMFTIEVAMGKASRTEPVGTYKILKPGTPWYLNGYVSAFINLIMTGYTAPIAGSVIAYLFKTATGVFKGMSPTEVEAYYTKFSSNPLEIVAWTSILVILLVLVLYRGLNKGIERITKVLMPILFVVLLILVVRSVTLPGAKEGILFYLKPDFTKFTWKAVMSAMGQSFFSIGIGLGCALTFGSYMRPKDKIVPNTTLIASVSTTAALLSGFLIFPLVFVFGLKPGAGVGLTFITMPNVFNKMPFGFLFGPLFWLLFFLAAFSAFLGGTEAIITHLKDRWKIERKKGTAIMAVTVMALAAIASTSTNFLAKVDYVAVNIFMMGAALITVIFVGWVWPVSKFLETAEIKSKTWRFYWTFIIKYFAPIVIIIIWLSQFNIIKK